MSELWASVLKRVSARIGQKSARDWFGPARQGSADPTELCIEVPNVLHQAWMDQHFRTVVDEVLAELAAEAGPSDPPVPSGVRFVVASDAAAQSAAASPSEDRTRRRTRSPRARSATSQFAFETPVVDVEVPARALPAHPALDPRYTFENFVVGSCNQFAHAAARAVADNPAKSYNPLYLYGGVGLGKTHLMHAIGQAWLAERPRMRVAYVSAERFMCEMINAIRWKRQPEFREKYRSVDALLVDDIQFLEGKEATQEEFFHTFRTLYEEGKQVVLSSDCPPRELATLEDRLRSRFESGLIADMQVPDLETKLAILRRRSDAEGPAIPDDVALYVANKVRSNVRELEGCLTRILALASLRGRAPDLDLAKEATRDVFPDDEKPVSVETIQRFVADYYNLRISDLKARNNARIVAFPRQVAMYLCKKMTPSSFPDIGKKFGGKHHSTVIHSVNKISAEAAKSEEFNHLLSRFIESIH